MEMYFKELLGKMKNIEENLIKFLEIPDKIDENFDIFLKYLLDQNISENKYEMKVFLYLLVAISNYYHRTKYFFTKIELIIKSLKDKIQNFFTSFEIFHIFQSNKRFLLFLFNLRIITPTEEIYYNIISNKKYLERKYLYYFYPEFELYMNDNVKMEIQKININIEEFNKKRENGENDNYLCKLIQDDSVINFERYLTESNISPSSSIPASIYETNLFLISKNPSLIEYSAFYGSIQIFKYLIKQNIKLTTSIWSYAVHGRNSEIIHYLEERKVKILCNSILCIESIKSHNNELYNYLSVHNFNKREAIFHDLLIRKSLKHFNFIFFNDKNIDILIELIKNKKPNNILYYLCKYDYFSLVDFLCKSTFIDVNFQYMIYKPFIEKCQKNILVYLAIKNCCFDHEKEKKDPIKRMIQLQKKISKYKYDYETSTILHISVRKGNLDIIKLLFSLPKLKFNNKSTKTSKKIRKLFDENFYYIITEERTILNEAIDCGFMEVFQFLLTKDCFNDFNDFKLIKTKFFNNYFSPESEYFEKKIEKTLLYQAIQKGNINIIKLILNKKNVDVNQKTISKIKEEGIGYITVYWERTIETSSLYYAIKCSNIKIVQLLVGKKNVDINVGINEILNVHKKDIKIQEKSPLYLAVENGNLKMVQLLLKQPKINVHFESTFYVEMNIFMYYDYEKAIQKKTILQTAAENENPKISQLLTKNKVI